jgi:hypothetical protein
MSIKVIKAVFKVQRLLKKLTMIHGHQTIYKDSKHKPYSHYDSYNYYTIQHFYIFISSEEVMFHKNN